MSDETLAYERDLLVRAARGFYVDDKSKVELAGELGVSRFKVARLLKAAKDGGVVEINVHEGPSLDPLSRDLKQRYGLRHVVVAPEPERVYDWVRWNALGKAAAQLLADIVTEDDILGVGWGRSVQAVLQHLTSMACCPVVQLTGMTGGMEFNSTDLIRRFAAVTRGPAYSLYAPMLLPNKSTVDAVKAKPEIAATFAMHEKITVAMMSVGSWDPPSSQLRAHFTTAEQRMLSRLNVRTEMGNLMLDAKGRLVHHELIDRILAISARSIMKIPNVIAVAGGPQKVLALHLAMSAGYVNSVVTDEQTAKALLKNTFRVRA